MNTTPTAPLIIIDKGSCYRIDLSGTTAALVDAENPERGYYLLDGPHFGWHIGDSQSPEEITAWRPCTAVPDDVIDKLHAAFYDINMNEQQREAFQALETYTF
jgi:hypothetical protein|nr:MAG TPA: hypothetical protein [Caudoviricetes sp.]